MGVTGEYPVLCSTADFCFSTARTWGTRHCLLSVLLFLCRAAQPRDQCTSLTPYPPKFGRCGHVAASLGSPNVPALSPFKPRISSSRQGVQVTEWQLSKPFTPVLFPFKSLVWKEGSNSKKMFVCVCNIRSITDSEWDTASEVHAGSDNWAWPIHEDHLQSAAHRREMRRLQHGSLLKLHVTLTDWVPRIKQLLSSNLPLKEKTCPKRIVSQKCVSKDTKGGIKISSNLEAFTAASRRSKPRCNIFFYLDDLDTSRNPSFRKY